MEKQTITLDRDDAFELCHSDPGELNEPGFRHEATEQLDSGRWTSYHSTVVRRLSDDTFWEFHWEKPLTEQQECDRFQLTADGRVEASRVWMKTSVVTVFVSEEPTRNDSASKCKMCGAVTFHFDPPLELEEVGARLEAAAEAVLAADVLPTVWAIYRQAWTPQTKTFSYIDGVFQTEASAREALKDMLDEMCDGDRVGVWEDEYTWLFEDDGERVSIGEVRVG